MGRHATPHDGPRLTPRDIIAGKRRTGNPNKQLTIREETFCNLRVRENLSQVDAYIRAGYAAKNIENGRANASKFSRKPHIRRRMEEIAAEVAAEKAGLPPPVMPDGNQVPDPNEITFDPVKGTPEDLIRLLTLNASQAHAVGKYGDFNTAMKLIAELRGFIEKGGPGRKSNPKTPNKGNVDDDAFDDEAAGRLPQINQFFLAIDRHADPGAEARDVTPVAAGTADVPEQVQLALPNDRDNGPGKQLGSVAELSRLFGTGVPDATTE